MLLRVHVETRFGSTCFDYHSDVIPRVGEIIALGSECVIDDVEKFKSTHNEVVWVSHLVRSVYQRETHNTINMCTGLAIGTKPHFFDQPTTNISEA